MNREQGTMSKALGAGRCALSEAVPVGYKRTEVGVIPEDWMARHLGSCLRHAPGYGINAPAVPYDDRLPTYLRITDISDDCRFRPSPRVSVRNSSAPMFFLNEGDLVFARTGASVGKSYRYEKKDGPLVFAGFLIRISPDPEKLEPTFLAYCVQSRRYWEWVATMSIRSGQPGINGQEYAMLQIPLPLLSEQRAIAEALSDVDRLLAVLEVLIAKKRAVKQAAMQQLLTGKTRLPGFSGKWETKRLGNIADLHRQNIVPAVFGDTLFIHFSLPAYDAGQGPVIEPGNRIGSNKFYVPDNAVLVSKLNPRIPRVWAPASIGCNSVASTEFLVLTPRDCTSRSFLSVLCMSAGFCEQMEILTTGTTGSHQRISSPEAMKIEVWLPCNADEQSAIAAVLSDMDAEIAVLEKRRDKIRAVKQGMMQQLLTGRVRLVEPDLDPPRS